MNTPELLSGLSAAQWARPLRNLSRAVFLLVFIAGGAYFASGATAETVPPWLFALWAITFATCGATYFITIAMLRKARREAKAGYTTTGGMHPEVPQIDYETGKVLREVGEPLFTEQRSPLKKRRK